MNNITKVVVGLALTILFCNFIQAEILYRIASFNNNASAADDNGGMWKTGITTINLADGVSGTDDAGLLSLQTLYPDADTTEGIPRFKNVGEATNKDYETVITDPGSGTEYFQFGITGTHITMSNLTF